MAAVAMPPFPVQAQGHAKVFAEDYSQDEKAKFYENIISLRDQIVAGTHPRLSAKLLDPRVDLRPLLSFPPPPPPPPVSSLNSQSAKAPESQSFWTVNGKQRDNDAFDQAQSDSTAAGQQLPSYKSSHSQIDPRLLDKSDELIKAEIQLQRRRIESSLKDQVDQRHRETAQRAFTPDFDVNDVLRQAQARVKPIAAQTASTPEANNSSDESLYSSVDNISSPGSKARSNRTGSDEQGRRMEVDEPFSQQAVVRPDERSNAQLEVQNIRRGPLKLATDAQSVERPVARQDAFGRMLREPEQSNEDYAQNQLEKTNISPGFSQSQSQSQSQRGREMALDGDMDQELVEPYVPSQPLISPRVPFIANRISSPLAPQPARISPLAITKEPPYTQNALRRRNESPDLEPQPLSAIPQTLSNESPRQSNPRKKRRIVSGKGRKVSSRVARESPEVYIKPESESPPLLSAAPLPQPRKRQHNNIESSHRRHQPPGSPRVRTGYGFQRYQEEGRQPARFISASHRRPSAEYIRYVRDPEEQLRYVNSLMPRPPSPYSSRFPVSEQRQTRAVSQYIEQPRRSEYYVDGPPESRLQYVAMERPRSPFATAGPYSSAPIRMSMAPPPITRITYDKYGREMTADSVITRHTPMPVSVRDSVVPQYRQREIENQPVSYHVQNTAPYTPYQEEPRYVEMLPARSISSAGHLQDTGPMPSYPPREFSSIPTDFSVDQAAPSRPYQISRPYSPGPARESSVLRSERRPIVSSYDGVEREYTRKPSSVRPEQQQQQQQVYQQQPYQQRQQTHESKPSQSNTHDQQVSYQQNQQQPQMYSQSVRVDTDRLDQGQASQRDFSIRREEPRSWQSTLSSAPRYALPSTERVQYVEDSPYIERPREHAPGVWENTVQIQPRR